MPEQFRCLGCGHSWKIRGDNLSYPQCPQCRRHRVVDNEVFEKAVIDLVRLLRSAGQYEPLEEFTQALDHARKIVGSTFPDPFLTGQAAFEVVREALRRLGFPEVPLP